MKRVELLMVALLLLVSCGKQGVGGDEVSVWASEESWKIQGCDSVGVDVFYIASTNVMKAEDSLGGEVWCAQLTEADREKLTTEMNWVAEHMFGGFRCVSPYYHQLTFDAYCRLPKDSFELIYSQVREEVCAAFDHYIAEQNEGRPFVLAGFSQGAQLTLDVVKHMTKEANERMVACYTIGYRLAEEDLRSPNIRAAEGEQDRGVVVSFNSTQSIAGIWAQLSDGAVTCMNPVNWRTDATPATFVYEGMTNVVHVDEAHQVLLVETEQPDYYHKTMDELGFFYEAGVSQDNLHLWDLLFYPEYIRQNALVRLGRQ